MALIEVKFPDRIDVHIHQESLGELKKIGESLLSIISNQSNIMATLADIQAQNTALIAAVTAEDTVIDSAVVLITGFGTTIANLQKQLADALAANDPAATQAVVDAMGGTITDINTKKDALAAAVAAGTPAA